MKNFYFVRLKNILVSILIILGLAFSVVCVSSPVGKAEKRLDVSFYKTVFAESLGTISAQTKQEDKHLGEKLLTFLNLDQGGQSLIAAVLPSLYSAKPVTGSTISAQQTSPIPTAPPQTIDKIKPTTIIKGNTTTNIPNLYLKNETNYDINASELINQKPDFIYDASKPQVLIVSTHTSEAYRPSEKYQFTASDTDRTEDISFNVSRVGLELYQTLKKQGINVLIDQSINDYPSYNGSYQKTLGLIQGYTAKYPSIELVIDVHRDAMVTEDGTKMQPVCTINGQQAAQIMLVIGTDANGLEHPNWKNNLAWGLKIQNQLIKSYPGLARPVNIRKERFNGHAANGEMIIEVGTTGNTLDEALISAKYVGEEIAKVIKQYK